MGLTCSPLRPSLKNRRVSSLFPGAERCADLQGLAPCCSQVDANNLTNYGVYMLIGTKTYSWGLATYDWVGGRLVGLVHGVLLWLMVSPKKTQNI